MAATEADRDAVIADVRTFYSNDTDMYNELTQEDHALQAAYAASQAGSDEATIVAALLHDVGWKLCKAEPKGGIDDLYEKRPDAECLAQKLGILAFCGNDGAGAEAQRAQHDVIGAAWLRMKGFEEKIAHLVEGHVLAKRYLTAVESDYFGKLNEDSVRTLKFQGGPMDSVEVAIFEKDPLFEACKQMRRWDEGAKVVGEKVPQLEHYIPMIRRCIVSAPSAPRASKTFIRDGNRIVGVHGVDGAQPAPPEVKKAKV